MTHHSLPGFIFVSLQIIAMTASAEEEVSETKEINTADYVLVDDRALVEIQESGSYSERRDIGCECLPESGFVLGSVRWRGRNLRCCNEINNAHSSNSEGLRMAQWKPHGQVG